LISLGVLTWLILGDTREKETMDTKELLRESNPFKAILDAKSIITLSIVLFLTVSVCTSFASTCYDQCFNYFIKDQFGFKPSYNGLLKAAVGMITLVANGTICTFLMKNTDIRKSIIGVLGMCAGMLVLVTITNQVIPFIIINLIMFGFNAIYQPMLQSTISLLKVRDKGTLVGIFNSMRSLGNVGGSLFAGFIYDTGPRLSFVFSATAFFIAMMAAVIFAKRECHQ
ncbi:MAG: MFS transporter, partial [Erysipelotrichaceae bacterium]|nr:MFS transporter [Erysipelotrichaceae bacterium]